MESSLVSVMTYTALPVTAMSIGGVIAAFRPPGPRLRSELQIPIWHCIIVIPTIQIFIIGTGTNRELETTPEGKL